MVETNIDYNGKDNIIKSTCWILSVLSWIFLIITELISFKNLNDRYIVWTFYKIPIVNHFLFGCKAADNPMGFYPVQMLIPFIYLVFIILVIFTIIGFIIYIIKSTCNKDNKIFEGMNGEWSKYHFIPLLFPSFLFLIGETISNYPNHKNLNIWGLIFVILGLPSLIFIYMKTDLPADWLPATIKKGVYSTLIALEWYYFCYDICNLKINNSSDEKGVKIFSGLFSVIIGIGGLFFALFFKDVVVSILYILIYFGCTVFFFKIDSVVRKNYNKIFDGFIDIIMMILFIFETVFIIIKYKNGCLN